MVMEEVSPTKNLRPVMSTTFLADLLATHRLQENDETGRRAMYRLPVIPDIRRDMGVQSACGSHHKRFFQDHLCCRSGKLVLAIHCNITERQRTDRKSQKKWFSFTASQD